MNRREYIEKLGGDYDWPTNYNDEAIDYVVMCAQDYARGDMTLDNLAYEIYQLLDSVRYHALKNCSDNQKES